MCCLVVGIYPWPGFEYAALYCDGQIIWLFFFFFRIPSMAIRMVRLLWIALFFPHFGCLSDKRNMISAVCHRDAVTQVDVQLTEGSHATEHEGG